ncbi:MAG: AAA family ATPase [Clostridia bacterium]|nr:AAA family ATPase [Clostridia bacterium]
MSTKQTILEQVLAYAKTVGGENKPLTAHRFLVAVVDLLDHVYTVEGANLQEISAVIAMAQLDTGKLKKVMLSHINSTAPAAYFDGLFMQKILLEAKDRAEKQAKELTVAAVLEDIILRPNAVMDGLLKACRKDGAAPVTPKPAESSVLPDDIMASFRNLTQQNAPAQPAQAAAPAAQTAPAGNTETADDIAALTAQAKEIQASLSKVVFGQDNAVGTFVSGFFQSEMLRMTDDKRTRPATFLFAGPPGVGKTFLAEQVAQLLGRPFQRFDMSEYSGHEATVEFVGSDDVYRNAKAGNVTGFVKKNPRCVLLFDEIEKAHYNIITLFLQLLDAGRLRDAKTDEEIDFKDAILIFTTNAGRQLYEDSDITDFSGLSKKVILRALQNDIDQRTGEPYFPAAICSRFASGNVVMFNHITAQNLVGIAKREMRRHADNFEKKFNITIDIDDAVYAALLFAEGGAADARTVRGRAEAFFNAEIHELYRLMSADDVSAVKAVKIGVKLPADNAQVRHLFLPAEKPTALIFADDAFATYCTENDTCNFIVTNDLAKAADALREKDIAFAVVDILCGVKENADGYLNIEDVESDGRTFLQHLYNRYNTTPVYMARGAREYTAEEKVSFARMGVRGEVNFCDGAQAFSARIADICESIHRQNSMLKLAKANKVAGFSTSQTVDTAAGVACIHLFDFRLTVAMDAEDAKNVLSNITKPNVKFSEVIGAEDAKKELQYFIKYLKDPKKFAGAQPPKGVILYGPPGTGKTMLAKAMASESDVTFISAVGSQFRKQYIGQGGDAIRDLFRTARKYAPSILFIDEIDAIAQERTGGESGGSREVEATLTALLTEMDGFRKDTTKPVFVLAATNFDVEPGSKKSLDAALMRRFDRRIFVDLPNRDERTRYLKERTAANPAYRLTDAKYDSIAIRSTGMSLALLESILELSLRMAIRDGDGKVTDEIFDEAYETFTGGERKEWDISTLERVARHEAGHAFLC